MRPNKTKGFTLIETLAAIAISAMLLGAIASYAMAFMQTTREGEVMHRLQRELVFSLEALDSEIRVAESVSGLGEAGPWVIQQITYDSGEYGERTVQVTHDPATMTLKLGSRVLSTNVAVFSISEGTLPGRLMLHIETIGSLPMIRSGNLPLTMENEVVMRNFGFEPPEEDPEDPEDPEEPPPVPLAIRNISPAPGGTITLVRIGNKNYAAVSCTTSIDARCQLEWAEGTSAFTPLLWTAVGTSHSWATIGPLNNNVQLRIRITADDPLLQPDVTTGVLTYTTRNN